MRQVELELGFRRACESLQFPESDPGVAKRHLLEFIRWDFPRYKPGWVHVLICDELERFSKAIAREESPRLMITMPPRHGKSEIVSRRFPIWHLGRNPDHEVVVASYSQDLANKMSRSARRVRDRATELWPHLKHGADLKDSTEFWQTMGGLPESLPGSFQAVGVSGGLTGNGAHALIVDDPFKNAEEANSETIRASRWEWYTQTAYTRLAPGGGVLVMNTRWHHDDLSGRLIQEQKLGGDTWLVINFPAIADEDEHHHRTGQLLRREGEALHASRFPLPELERRRRVLGTRGWEALYQQRPTALEGNLFQRDWTTNRYVWDFQRHDWDQRVVTVDATFKRSKTADYVSIQAWASKGPKEYLGDEIHERMSYTELREALRDFIMKHNPNVILIEEKANGAALIDELSREFPGVTPFVPDRHGDKVSRASVVTARWAAGDVYLPERAEWLSDYVSELCAFPLGAHDDRVDAMTQYLIWRQEQRRREDWSARAGNLRAIGQQAKTGTIPERRAPHATRTQAERLELRRRRELGLDG